MYPNAYLQAYWRKELKPQVFVAMSFDSRYDTRYETVIRPAIEGAPLLGRVLKAFRVDMSRTGDSILTDIVEGIAHSQLVLVDLSVVGRSEC